MSRHIVLNLYVFGRHSSAESALSGITELWQGTRREQVELAVIDVSQFPQLAEQNKVLATPTLVRERPLPRRKVIGDLSELDRVAAFLGLQARKQRRKSRRPGRSA